MKSVFSALENERPEYKDAMKTWHARLEPFLTDLEAQRVAVIAKATRRTVTTAFTALLVVAVLLFLSRGSMAGLIIAGGVVSTLVSSSVAWLPLTTMRSQTKQEVVGAAAEAFGFDYDTLHTEVRGVDSWKSASTWLKKNGQNAAALSFLRDDDEANAPTPAFGVLKAAKLLPTYDHIHFEDLISGHRADADFSMVECKLTDEQGSGKNKRTVVTFQGLLFHIQYPESFLGTTIIARQGWWKGLFGHGELKKVDLVSKELEDNFTIYSNDQVEARALLTPDRMLRLIALERHFKGGRLRGIFDGDHLTLALQAKNQFETGSIWNTLVDPSRYVTTLQEIALVCDVIDGFLTREWVKDNI